MKVQKMDFNSDPDRRRTHSRRLRRVGAGSAPPTDNTPPTATVLPGSGSTIGGSMPIVLTFNGVCQPLRSR